MTDEALWEELPDQAWQRCRGPVRVFVIRHAGREQFGRQACGSGLAGRIAAIAFKRRISPDSARMAPAVSAEPVTASSAEQQDDIRRHVLDRLSNMAASWKRKTLAGFVDVYADDVIIERPDGVLRGRAAVVDWARRQQDWLSPLEGVRRVLHQASIPPVRGNFFNGRHGFRWDEAGKPLRQTFSTLWRNEAGFWQIAYERASQVMPVADVISAGEARRVSRQAASR